MTLQEQTQTADDTTSEQQSDKRVRILRATETLIVRYGLEFPMSRIARESGIAVGSIYNYFPSKSALVLGVYQHLASQINAAFVATDDAGSDDPKAMVMAYIHSYIEFFWADADRAILFEYLTNLPMIETPEVAEVFKPLRDYNRAIFTFAQEQGVLKSFAPRSMAGFVGGGIRNALKWHRATQNHLSDEQKDNIAQMSWASIAA
ncbi:MULTISPECIES: TetR/AcrR family transcriptional regulator [Roseobacteraceae]|uniref:Putative HTH-type transcriptional regulator n=1 Tax=Pseudosulfitobacter pseudonitzschiae TaxID=1402135 RepID=A0A221K632_9RHOB|nr:MULTISPECIES: TetR/AcrR family transcriptional regulator [Roseobacteraceae]ASM74340.1 putative HTH-type transcriptional regulator [Pseudosulfitobacter pseudonitzschiae]